LSETHIKTFDEKRFLLGHLQDREILDKNEAEDKRKIQELLALSDDYDQNGKENIGPQERRPGHDFHETRL